MKSSGFLAFINAAVVLTACTKDDTQYRTVVEGTVVNKHTGQPVADVPIEVRKITNGMFSGSGSVDLITAAHTNANGKYSMGFKATKYASYQVKMTRHDDLFDTDNGVGGYRTAQYGVKNLFDFSVIPYKLVTVNVRTSKGGKTDISLGYSTTDQGPQFGGTVLNDTVKANQNFIFSRTYKVVPNRSYRFYKVTANRFKVPNTSYYEFKDYTWTYIYRTIGYNDTTIVAFN